VLPPATGVLPTSWGNAIFPYIPNRAGGAIMEIGYHDQTLAPWTGLGVLAAYVVASIAIAAVLLRRRDV
jgi:ABC-2 type transport system permease protein